VARVGAAQLTPSNGSFEFNDESIIIIDQLSIYRDSSISFRRLATLNEFNNNPPTDGGGAMRARGEGAGRQKLQISLKVGRFRMGTKLGSLNGITGDPSL